MRILMLCTGNSCRSQMAEAFLRSFGLDMEVFSAGTEPSDQVHPKAIEVMQEIGIDMTDQFPKHVDEYLQVAFDYVITVCDHARETCPVFSGQVKQFLHIGFDDPAAATGTEEEIRSEFRRIRDEIHKQMQSFVRRRNY